MAGPKLKIRSKVWLENEAGEVVFGLGRMKILEAVQRLGSIHAAGKELNIGYRAIWARIKATEDRLGEPLLIKKIGGATGGGSTLTSLAEELVTEYGKVQKTIADKTDAQFEKRLGMHLDL
ncbi:LysR family transcriptional regulator [Desulfoluna sp.]|uniref:winged helix-turn-helix domain-containing protein n=1 Tax=Desulfoluna sp. TaxID=2045199 RepID=UPI00261CFF19|nr:LysR family transcriptional regulator [Desulfoluna sp.]